MSEIVAIGGVLASDDVLFLALQAGLILFVLYAVLRHGIQRLRAGRGEVSFVVERGDQSMSRFYATYAGVSGLLVAICLTVSTAEDYRIFWVLIDTVAVAYVCLLNPWFRNLLLGWANRLKKLERG